MTTSKGIFREDVPLWFIYINASNSEKYYASLKDTLQFKYSYSSELKKIDGPRKLARLIRDGYRFRSYRKKCLRPVMKDPIALMSAEWLSDKFHMDMVVLIRNPFAFCSSLMKLKFEHPFSHFLQQPDLMSLYLTEFSEEITDFTKNNKSILEQGVLLWNIIHHVIFQYQIKCPDWGYYRHEDLSLDPVTEFKKMYSQVGLAFTVEVENSIRISSGIINEDRNESSKTLMVRDSLADLQSWKKHLSDKDVEFIRSNTEKYLKHFYPDIDHII